MNPRALILGSLGLLLVGCFAESAEDSSLGTKESALLTDSWSLYLSGGYKLSFDLVSHGLNGQTWNGKTLDGHTVQAVSLDAVSLDTRTVDLRLAGTEFKPANAGGNNGGRPVVGARFSATLDDGDVIVLRVEDVVSGSGSDRDVNRYAVSYETKDGPRSFCGMNADGSPIRAIPLAGRWEYRASVPGAGAHVDDARAFTFACEGKVLAECVTMGYKPWVEGRLCQSAKGGPSCKVVSIASYHQACTRMLRADYCGDGVAHTVDGTPIDSHDALGIRVQKTPFSFEAEWTEAGARCAARTRLPGATLPSCWARLQSESCGAESHFLDGTLLMSGVQ